MDPARMRRSQSLLTLHFLRGFLENDLISPEADRSQLVAVVGAMLVSFTLFASVFQSFDYVIATLTPGQAAVFSLDDKAFYLGLATIVTALVATAQWDALSVSPRDAAILEPLPIPAAAIRRAKLAAVAIFGVVVAMAVTACPTIIFPWLLVFNFPQVSILSLFGLIATHLATALAAAAFGYLAVIALREGLVAILGQKGFAQASALVQGALIVALGGSLLLLPPATNRIAQRGFEGWKVATPPMWFLGAYELTTGHIIADLPREPTTSRRADADRTATALYNQRREQFAPLARRAGIALALTALFAGVLSYWNARRVPSIAPLPPPQFHRRWRRLEPRLNDAVLRTGAMRAGFYFALAAMWRSGTHRVTLACAGAAGMAMALVALLNAEPPARGASPAILAMQPLLYGALLVGFRHVVRVPAELRANWGFQLAWRGDTAAFLAGVKLAAVLTLVLPALIVLLPFFIGVLGMPLALAHALLGLAGGVVLLEGLMLQYDKVPFTCTYVPDENIKALAPLYAIAFLIGASMFARVQSRALYEGRAMTAVVLLTVTYAVLRAISETRRRPPHVEFDEAPATVQRLGLNL